MLSSEISVVLEIAKQFDSKDFLNRVSLQYGDNFDLENIQINTLSLSQFYSLSIKVISQFINSFDELGIVLPISFNHPMYGVGSIIAKLQNFITNVKASPIDLLSAENNLLWIVLYQIEYGFHNINGEKQINYLVEKENSLISRLELLYKSFSNQRNKNDFLYEDLLQTKNEVSEFVELKKEELRQISNNLSITNDQTNQGADLLNKSTEANTKIISLQGIQEENKNKFDKLLSELTINAKIIDDKIIVFNQQVTENELNLKSVESHTEYFAERNKYLSDLIGREVGVSLFETFKQRKTELRKSVLFWTWAVPVMAVITVVWILFLFKNIEGSNNLLNPALWWEYFALNTLKAFPAVLLLFFTINQYRSERNFQEEYAFKSAVALTIDAYANRITDVSNKDKMLMDSVTNMYKTPFKVKKESINLKKLLNLAKTLKEVTKDSSKD